jgi:hypothetical protein
MTVYAPPLHSPLRSPLHSPVVGKWGAADSLSLSAQTDALIATFLATTQAASYYSKLDALYLMVAGNRLVNRKNAGTYDLTLGGSAVYIDGAGIYCDPATSSYVDTNMNPSTAIGAKFTRNDASFGVFARNDQAISTGSAIGQFSTNGCTLVPRSTTNNDATFRVNQNASTSLSGGSTGMYGLAAADRSASNATKMYHLGLSLGTGSAASTALVNRNFCFGTATGSTFATPAMTFGGGWIGGSLTAQEHLDLHNAFDAFFTAYDALNLIYKPQINSWWDNPIAEVQDGRIVVGGAIGGTVSGVDLSGTQSLMEIRESDGAVMAIKRLQNIYPLDDHHIQATLRLLSGKRLCFLTGHGTVKGGAADHTLGIAISQSGRIANFGSISTIANTMTAVNYGQLFQMDNGRVVIHTTMDGDKLIGLVYSDDDFTTPVICKPHVTQAAAPGGGQNQLYEKVVKTGASALRMFSIPHPSNTQNNIRIARIDTSDGHYYSGAGGATDKGTIYAAFGAALADVTSLSAITALAAGRSQRLLDVTSDGTAFVVVEYDNPGGTNASYYLYRLTGADPFTAAHWTKSSAIIGAGVPFWASSFYYGGAVFAREPHNHNYRLYIARESGGTKTIERHDTDDNGASWSPTVLKSSATLLARPIATGSSLIPVIWQRITVYTQFDSWSGASLEWQ